MLTTTPIEDLKPSPTLVFERAGGDKPVCVANAIFRVYE